MREPYGEAVATRAGPELWWCVREGTLQALVGVRVGWVLSRESFPSSGCRGCSLGPKASSVASLARDAAGPRAVGDPMHARRLSGQELGGPAIGHGGDGAGVRAVNPTGAIRR
jgi:hypothetical protein